jgi:hypothetical protein
MATEPVYSFQLKQKDHFPPLSFFHVLIALIFLFDCWHSDKLLRKDWIFTATSLMAGIFLLIAGLLGWKKKLSFQKLLSLLLFEFFLIISSAIYFWSEGKLFVAISHALLAGAIILFWIVLKAKEDGEKIIVSASNIILPGLFHHRVVEWKDLSNLIRKDNLLTIDFRNNKLIQVEVTPTDLSLEEEFNRFCKQQLIAVNK